MPKHASKGPTAGISALSAITALPASHSEQFRCELCQASFMSGVQYQQHMQSAVHRKAMEKAEAERMRAQQLQQ